MKKIIFTGILTSLILMAIRPSRSQEVNKSFTLVIHGGAGTILKQHMSPAMEKEYRDALNKALDAGYEILKNGGSSIEAVTAVIVLLEDSPLFNAGRGSVLTSTGKIEMDASIMDGKTLNAGAVAGVSTIKNPILAAHAIMVNSPHVFLTSEGAETFARQQGLQFMDAAWFYTKNRKDALEKAKEREAQEEGMNWMEKEKDESLKHGTVGAVALDIHGNLAAATSTGGMTNKKFGRIGDSPIIGAGTYANNATAAISCTGHGEYFIRLAIAHDISALIAYKGMTAKEAGNEVIMKKLTHLGGTGGAIILDKNGNIAMPFNTEGMYRGYIRSDGAKKVHIFKDEGAKK
jgi:L-asparaginase / beta-aspartyl-peptidase